MINATLNEILLNLNEIAKFVSFQRKKIKAKSIELLVKIDFELNNIQLEKTKLFDVLRQKKAEYNSLKREHESLQEKYTIISDILSAKPASNEGLEHFKKLVKNDFLNFANEESSLAEEATAILRLQAVERELELIVSFPSVYSKNTIAIGGGFSSGKSAFVNSFFQDKSINLPIGIEPVTAVPTYVISDKSNYIKGFSKNGGAVSVDFAFYEKLSHKFIKSFGFNLKDIMPFIAIGSSLEQKYFKHICLLDTPGYNPAISDGFTEDDRDTAFQLLERANALIWMVGLDVNGTLPSSDLKLLSELDLTHKKLYLIANKADLRSENEIEEILMEFQGLLSDYDLPYEGISIYSADLQKEYSYKKMSLYKFLKKENNPVQIITSINFKLDEIFDMYKNAIEKDIKAQKKIKTHFKSLELDAMETGYEFNDNLVIERIEKIRSFFDTNELNKQLTKLENIRTAMKNSVEEIFRNLSIS